MKKLLSLCTLAACSALVQAQPSSAPTWTESFKAVAEVADAHRTAPVAITQDGNVYSTGRFNQTIATDKIFLEPVAQDILFSDAHEICISEVFCKFQVSSCLLS